MNYVQERNLDHKFRISHENHLKIYVINLSEKNSALASNYIRYVPVVLLIRNNFKTIYCFYCKTNQREIKEFHSLVVMLILSRIQITIDNNYANSFTEEKPNQSIMIYFFLTAETLSEYQQVYIRFFP